MIAIMHSLIRLYCHADACSFIELYITAHNNVAFYRRLSSTQVTQAVNLSSFIG